VANYSANGTLGPGGVGVLIGKGDGTFRATVSYASGGDNASSVAVADVNLDGKLDLLVSQQLSRQRGPAIRQRGWNIPGGELHHVWCLGFGCCRRKRGRQAGYARSEPDRWRRHSAAWKWDQSALGVSP
jgi:hypothetical protein